MNIEFRFLQKAILDKNYISFTYGNQSFKNVKPLKLDSKNRLFCDKDNRIIINLRHFISPNSSQPNTHSPTQIED